MSGAMAKLPDDHPLILAFNAYKGTDAYTNSRYWAKYESAVDGSLWAAFSAGYAHTDSLHSHASSLAEAISQYLEARLKPDQTALSVTGLCKALNDYLDFTGEPNKERNLTASRGRNE